MNLNISKWYKGYQSPAVLMIDDLNDVYINIYQEKYKNDWGYLCNQEDSAYYFLETKLLNDYPEVKITFFVPYARHSVVNESINNYKKYAVGERREFTDFLIYLENQGHEVAHHGSNHGKYINETNLSTYNNFIHEWELFDNIKEGVAITQKGIEVFYKEVGAEVTGGKFCGYIMRNNSLDIIDKCQFEYWCIDAKLNPNDSNTYFFGKNNVIALPTNVNGNAFVRLQYKTGNFKRDIVKFFVRFLQPLYNITQYTHIDKLYEQGNIISIQEHISPSTSAGGIQASNIVSDIKSLQKIFTYLKRKSIWYATCKEIARYIYVRKNSMLKIYDKIIEIHFNNYKKLEDTFITIESDKNFSLEDAKGKKYNTKNIDNKYTVTVNLSHGNNKFSIIGLKA